MKRPSFKKLNIPTLFDISAKLQNQGKVLQSKNNLVYLDIDNAYIDLLFPLLTGQNAQRPHYFGEGGAGAHISIIYPEENKIFQKEDLNQPHVFSVKELVAAQIHQKIYYALLLEAPSLLQLRRKYKLPDMLDFKGYSIEFHITIGTKLLSSL